MWIGSLLSTNFKMAIIQEACDNLIRIHSKLGFIILILTLIFILPEWYLWLKIWKKFLSVVLDFDVPLTGKTRIWNITLDMINSKFWFITGILSRISVAEVVINKVQL